MWLARDQVLDRTVAIKELQATYPESDRAVIHERSQRESSASKRLAGHPNIVTVLGELWEDGRPWIVMEYVPGRSLQDRIRDDGPVSPWQAAAIGVDVLDALRHAHAAGILHRDVKPSNILLTVEGRAVLTDFGIALTAGDAALTETGVVVGSPGFIAPELINGQPASEASDLWSLGATLYTAVEGHLPYQRDDVSSMLSAVLSEPVPRPASAGPLEPVLMGLLARDPAARMSADAAAPVLAEVADVYDEPVIEGLEIDRRIGAAAWHARDESGEEVVVKAPARLAEVARSLKSWPLHGVVRVHDVGELPDGRAYVVMEYADGGSMAKWTPADPLRTRDLTVEVARLVAGVNETGAHYKTLPPRRILLRDGAEDGEQILLPIPDTVSGDPIDDARALGELANGLLTASYGDSAGAASDDMIEVIEQALRGELPDAAAVAVALDAVFPGAGVVRAAAHPVDLATGQGLPSDDQPWYANRRYATQDVPYSPSSTPRRRRFVPFWGTVRIPGRTRRAAPLSDVTGPQSLPSPEDAALYTPLRASFRYVHEPLRVGDEAISLLGNERLITALKERLGNSLGGTFLVTGFRGVGKSTLIEQALAEIAADHPRGRRVLPVVLSVARPLETERLLFAIVRRVFEELTEAGILESLPAATRQRLVLAYMRTSLSFKETRADATERTASVDLDLAKIARLNPVGMAIPKVGMSTKRSRSLATEAAFLAYSETDVEHDMTRIVGMLSAVPSAAPRRRLLLRRPLKPLDLQLIVVLDEVDKLTALQDGLEKVELLLSGIKNVVTMRGAHYLVVAGPDLHDRVLRDSGRGNSIYESIFAWRTYVPCSWSAPGRLLEDLGLPPASAGGVVEEFEKYLRYKSRGVLRRLLQELNSFVVWDEDRTPHLRIGPRSDEAITFYARLERSLDAFFTATRRQVPRTALDQDRWRLCAYYVMDWILRSQGRPFTSADVIQAVQDGEFDPLLHVSQSGVELLLDHLAAESILIVVREPARATSTLIPDVAEAQRASYTLDDALLDRLFRILAHQEDEQVPWGADPPGRTVPIETLSGDRYELWRLIGEGGTSSVYEGRDTLLQRPIAVKMLRTALRADPQARSRFLREAMIAGAVHHPNVVDVYEVVTISLNDDRRYAIVMELIAGPTLDQTLERQGPLSARQVVQIGITLAGALDYLADKGLARLDLKPHNVVMSPSRGPVIIDLGIAKIVENTQAWLIDPSEPTANADPKTQLGIVIGTPAYLAPEQARGDEVDIRADIYALGLVLCTCLAGHHPYQNLDPSAVMARAMLGGLETSNLPCSPEMRAVLARATTRDPSDRYPRPSDLLTALRTTPEAKA